MRHNTHANLRIVNSYLLIIGIIKTTGYVNVYHGARTRSIKLCNVHNAYSVDVVALYDRVIFKVKNKTK